MGIFTSRRETLDSPSDLISCAYYPLLVRFDAAEKSAAKPLGTETSAVPSTFQGSARRAFLHACRAGFVAAGAAAPVPFKPASASSVSSASNARAAAVLRSVQTSNSLRAHVAIARFLVDGLRGARSCQLEQRYFPALSNFYWLPYTRGIAAFSRDGTCIYGVQAPRLTLAALRIADSAPLHTFNRLLFPIRVTVAPDDSVVVADDGNQRILILSRLLEPQSIIPVKDRGIQRAWLLYTAFIAASDDSVAAITAAPYGTSFLSTYSRKSGGALWRRVLNRRDIDTNTRMYYRPCALCFLSDKRSIAVADASDPTGSGLIEPHVTIFSEHGDITRHIRICPDPAQVAGVRALACSAHDELVVALGRSGTLVFVDARSGDVFRREVVSVPRLADAEPVHIDIRGTSVDVWWVGSYINPDTLQYMRYTYNLALSALHFF